MHGHQNQTQARGAGGVRVKCQVVIRIRSLNSINTQRFYHLTNLGKLGRCKRTATTGVRCKVYYKDVHRYQASGRDYDKTLFFFEELSEAEMTGPCGGQTPSRVRVPGSESETTIQPGEFS
ncbi:hypothetical protein ElyMa_004063500 [Elysia marginata]|uniref:Uncharacterized protein n=1 Tax=Elysia marginata TaxID=1093978 RepID=A0AAV4G919_9GAST|nr:hypothetical protein ElyMa_004063500 [Elysia marginata]